MPSVDGIYSYDDTEEVSPLKGYMNRLGDSVRAKFAGNRLWSAIKTAETAPGTAANTEVSIGSITIADALAGKYRLTAHSMAYHASANTAAWIRFYAGPTLLAALRCDLPVGLGLKQVNEWVYDHPGGTVTLDARLFCGTQPFGRQTCGEGLIVARPL